MPTYIVCDRGKQFDGNGFRVWCKRKGIKPPRYGAIGRHGSIAVVERFILTMKGVLSCLLLTPFRREAFCASLRRLRIGTTNRARIRGSAAARPTRSITVTSPPTASLASSRVHVGHVARLAQALGLG